jgi:hypothetical protein
MESAKAIGTMAFKFSMSPSSHFPPKKDASKQPIQNKKHNDVEL